MSNPSSSRRGAREYVFPALLALAIFAVGSVLYLYAYRTAPPGERFMDFVGRGAFGANGHFMFARQARDGAHLMENRSTPEPLPRAYFNVEWWIFGKAARCTGLSLAAMFHVGRGLTALGSVSRPITLRRCVWERSSNGGWRFC